MTCVIIDDEPLAIKLLESYVKKTPDLQLVASYNSAVNAIAGLAQQHVDVLFLDIQMPDVDGLSFARLIQNGDTQIIFTTAYSEYAADSYKVCATDYLLKPITYEAFLAATAKVAKALEMRRAAKAESAGMGSRGASGCIYVRSDYKLVRIATDNITYIEGLKDYVKIHLADDSEPILTLAAMHAVEVTLPDNFMRIHRSYIVNLDKITVIERSNIIFGDDIVPISDTYKERLLAFIQKRSFSSR